MTGIGQKTVYGALLPKNLLIEPGWHEITKSGMNTYLFLVLSVFFGQSLDGT